MIIHVDNEAEVQQIGNRMTGCEPKEQDFDLISEIIDTLNNMQPIIQVKWIKAHTN